MSFYTPKSDISKLKESNIIDPNLPRVLIIGDSISIGYTPYVQELMTNKANIIRPDANCGDTAYGLKNLNIWLGDSKWDLIHFNWGLHDLCYRHPDSKVYGNRDKVHGKISVTLDKYKENLQKLVAKLKENSNFLIWANTTFIPKNEAGRHQGDENIYNEIAKKIMHTNDIKINDLSSLTRSFDASLFTCEGDVHFTQEGYLLIGRQVATSIEEKLS